MCVFVCDDAIIYLNETIPLFTLSRGYISHRAPYTHHRINDLLLRLRNPYELLIKSYISQFCFIPRRTYVNNKASSRISTDTNITTIGCETPCIFNIFLTFVYHIETHWACLVLLLRQLKQEAKIHNNDTRHMRTERQNDAWIFDAYICIYCCCYTLCDYYFHFLPAFTIENFLNKTTSLLWVSILIIISLIKTMNVNIFLI